MLVRKKFKRNTIEEQGRNQQLLINIKIKVSSQRQEMASQAKDLTAHLFPEVFRFLCAAPYLSPIRYCYGPIVIRLVKRINRGLEHIPGVSTLRSNMLSY